MCGERRRKEEKADKGASPIFSALPPPTKNIRDYFLFLLRHLLLVGALIIFYFFFFSFVRTEGNDTLDKLLTTDGNNFNLDCYITFFFSLSCLRYREQMALFAYKFADLPPRSRTSDSAARKRPLLISRILTDCYRKIYVEKHRKKNYC